MLKSVLIANRGAIATRIIRSLEQMGISSIAVYAEADRDSLHVQRASQSFSLGDGAATTTYLDQDKILAIAREAGADAIHPGYGFLSENPDFVRRCEQQRLTFLGPTAEQIEAFGLKHRARELASASEVPLVPGSGLLDSLEQALQQAADIGYPVMLKSTAGGGGIGMSVCHDAEELDNAFDSVKRLSQNNFGDSSVFLEKYIETSRHIEVQVLGDGQGGVLTLGARDCSLQRRNQKVVEETPPPLLAAELVSELETTASRLMTAINYRSAGTVEFIYDVASQNYYFLEVNTRLQVEHGVTETIYDFDLVQAMVQLGQGQLPELGQLSVGLQPRGHSIQVRVYAEDPNKDFQPCAGQLSFTKWPDLAAVRVDHWLDISQDISPYFDPMLGKIIVHGDDRAQALAKMQQALAATELYGIETNLAYLQQVLDQPEVKAGKVHTHLLETLDYQPHSFDVLSAGTLTTIQDYPGRRGYWHVGVPPSGPFDDWSFRLGNRLLGNAAGQAGLEVTLNGPSLRFNNNSAIVIAGAEIDIKLNDKAMPMWQVIEVKAGDQLALGKINNGGSRSYVLFAGGLQSPSYLDSQATFALGKFGGHNGRQLQVGDSIHFVPSPEIKPQVIDAALKPAIGREWTLHVIYGPHGAPDFFTDDDIDSFFNSEWEVHYNSSRTGIRLIGPKPQWARSDGGEAGMHPSNIHDNAYAIGTIDFTGDMPVILGPDGPSLGGFVCPATVISADRWKLGQLHAGDRLRFQPVSLEHAVAAESKQLAMLRDLRPRAVPFNRVDLSSAIVKRLAAADIGIEVVYRPSGDKYLLVEYGPQVLDIELRFRVHALMQWLQQNQLDGLMELTPGIRSLQLHYDSQQLSLAQLLDHLEQGERTLTDLENMELPSRIVHLPLSWDDEACRLAIDKYMQSVRDDAPWCPSNIEFIRRINGLDSIEEVKRIVFAASYLVMGLGDVYLGAPVATPLDPRHRLVTTKYNPARTWTAENSVGIGGAYLCVYGMEGPGGYQFVGRTLQMWNRDRCTREFTQPWLLRFFDQIRFYPVSAEDLVQIREDFPKGRYPLKIEETRFNLRQYKDFLQQHAEEIDAFIGHRNQSFDDELQQWIESGLIHYEANQNLAIDEDSDDQLPDQCVSIDSPVAGNVWEVMVEDGQTIADGETLVIIESMKMEIKIDAPHAGIVHAIRKPAGSQVNAGQPLIWLEVQEA
ncbi:MAG: urea carboxylase [Gammaproteobacteria bacterium]|nr:urea carboxylase [Gammaproteobacteria bacterium]